MTDAGRELVCDQHFDGIVRPNLAGYGIGALEFLGACAKASVLAKYREMYPLPAGRDRGETTGDAG